MSLGAVGRVQGGNPQVLSVNMGAPQPPDARLQLNPYLPKRSYALNYSVNANGGSLGNLNNASAGHLVNIKGSGVNLRDQSKNLFSKQRSLINQQSQSPTTGERAAPNNSQILGVQSLSQKQYQSNKYY